MDVIKLRTLLAAATLFTLFAGAMQQIKAQLLAVPAALLLTPALLGVRNIVKRVSRAALRSKHWWDVCVPQMPLADFIRTFRVSRSVFRQLVDCLHRSTAVQRPCNEGRAVSLELRVAITLYKCSRAISYYDVAQKFGVAEATAFSIVWSTIDILAQALYKTQVSDRWPTTPEDLAAAAAAFSTMYVDSSYPSHCIHHCIGSLDGTLLPIWCISGLNEIFYCRKGFYAVNIQSTCDANMFFTWIGQGRPGTVWDGNAIANEDLTTTLLPNLPAPYFIVNDSGYRGTAKMLGPYKRGRGDPELSPPKRRFNYVHALLRGIIEKTFGVIKAKFRWMLKGVQFEEPSQYPRMFTFCAIVHNMMNEERLGLSQNELRSRPGLFEVEVNEEDKDNDSTFLGKHSEAHAANLRKFYAEELAVQRALKEAEMQQRGAGRRAAAPNAAQSAVPEDAVDTLEAAVYVEDDVTGVTLRDKIFNDMNLSTYVPSVAHKDDAEKRGQKRRARATSAHDKAEAEL